MFRQLVTTIAVIFLVAFVAFIVAGSLLTAVVIGVALGIYRWGHKYVRLTKSRFTPKRGQNPHFRDYIDAEFEVISHHHEEENSQEVESSASKEQK